MNVVDSGGWLEYFADTPQADFFAPALEATGDLLVPVLCLAEVARAIRRQRDPETTRQVLAWMREGEVIVPDDEIILLAAELASRHRLPLAGCIILATARARGATLWTQDRSFQGLESVNCLHNT